MRRKGSFRLSVAKIALGITAIGACCFGLEAYRRRVEVAPEPEIIRPVRTIALTGTASERVRHYFGTVQGSRRVNLSFRVPGTLQLLPAEKGAQVKKGELLGSLDPRDFRTSLAQAEGVLAQARATYNNAATNFKRYEELYKQKVIAAAAYDDYKAQLDITRAAVRQAEASVTAARDALRDTELHAPFDGMIVDRLVENFQDVVAKQTIINFQNVDTLEIVFNVPDRDVLLSPVRIPSDTHELRVVEALFKMTASFDAIPGSAYPLRMKEFSAQTDSSTRTYPFTVTMQQPPEARVLPGMTANVTVDFSGLHEAQSFYVPESAVLDEDGSKFIWRYENGVVHKVPVTLLGWHGTELNIQSTQLSEGETIVTAGVHFLKEGEKVRLQKSQSK